MSFLCDLKCPCRGWCDLRPRNEGVGECKIPPAPVTPVNISSSRGLVTSYPFPSLSGSKSSHLIVTKA